MRRRHGRCKSLPHNPSLVAATAAPRRFVARGGRAQLIGRSVRPSRATTLRVVQALGENTRRNARGVPLAATVSKNCGPRPAKRAPARAVVQHSAPSHPPAARGRPNAAQRRFTAAQRTLVAALTASHRPPARAELTNTHRDTAVASRSRRALVRCGNRRATAGEREFGALTPVRTLLPTRSDRCRTCILSVLP